MDVTTAIVPICCVATRINSVSHPVRGKATMKEIEKDYLSYLLVASLMEVTSERD